MKKTNIIELFLILGTVFQFPAYGQAGWSGPDPQQLLPFDQKVISGTLNNGLKYFVRENPKPGKRAQLWLAVNAGSVLEEDDQKGMAHFVEHMAFNGTVHYEKQEIVNFLESLGMKFGPEINAYTGFDETVYMLQVPTDSLAVVDQGLSILRDWAGYISFDKEEVEKERGVIIEEWRLGQGASMRMLSKQLPFLLQGSRYAERLPIGERKILESFSHDRLKQFYSDWYRPEMMAIIAVGDFDGRTMEQKIIHQFSSLPASKEPVDRPAFPVPDHSETLVAIARDAENPTTSVSLHFKTDPESRETIADYRRMLMENLVVGMMNFRLYEKVQEPEPPFLFAYASHGAFVRTKDFYSLNAAVKEDGVLTGLHALITEARRIQKHGFVAAELERARANLLKQMEQVLRESGKTNSSQYASEFVRHFLEGEPVPGIEYEYSLSRDLLPEISLEEVNSVISRWLPGKNAVLLVNGLEKEGLEMPSEEEILAFMQETEKDNISHFVDDMPAGDLVAPLPLNAKIRKEKKRPDTGITEWILSNGIRIIMKPTDFRNDEVVFQAFSFGGTSLSSDKDFMSASMATNLVRESGVSGFSYTQLFKKLSGKIVTVFPMVGTYSEGFSGSAAPRDLETMFQLIYAYAMTPRLDPESFTSYMNRMKGFIENRSASPESALYDTIQVTLAGYHFRERPWSPALLEEVDRNAALSFYRDRFADTDDFTFIFVGNFTPAELRPLVIRYLGNLPSKPAKESWSDPGIIRPETSIRKTVYRGIEPSARVVISYHGAASWSRENSHALSSLLQAMRIRLRETLREDMGGTYGVQVSGSISRIPREEYNLNISFGCQPERVEELIATVYQLIDSFKQNVAEEDLVNKVREMQARDYETNLKENQYWLNQLLNSYYFDQDPSLILEYKKLVNSLTGDTIRQSALKYLGSSGRMEFILMPEKKERILPDPEK